jgi:SAM-dependent methyltransferase
MTAEHKDIWVSGNLYDRFMGRWSRLVAVEFITWLAARPNLDWLDVGCGTGMVSKIILEGAQPHSVIGVDPSAGFIRHAKAMITDRRVAFYVAEGQSLPVGSTLFDIAVSGLVLNFVPEPYRMVSEMTRAVRSGGVVALYVWDYPGKMELLRHFWDAAVELNPAAIELDEAWRFPLSRPAPLAELFTKAGLHDIQVHTIDIPTRFRDFAEYWSPFLGSQGPAPDYAMSLNEQQRAALRERLRASLPVASDGKIDLIARAWAVRGRAP